MIIARTPIRISFTGGGSDLPSYYRERGGAVISTSIDKYIYVTVNVSFDPIIRFKYSKTEVVNAPEEMEHQYMREILKSLDVRSSVEITSIADIPSKGSGLGSSSAFTVASLHALYAFKSQFVSAERLAREACAIEIEKCGQPIGLQDQYASAYGGLNFIRFNPDDTVNVDPIICKKETKRAMDEGLIMFYTGITRSASGILQEQSAGMATDAKKRATMDEMVKLTHELKRQLESNDVSRFGKLLHENWLLKRGITDKVSTGQIDDWYARALTAGAEGGKLLGAGGGGFLLFWAPKDRHEAVRHALSDLRHIPFSFESEGSKIIIVN